MTRASDGLRKVEIRIAIVMPQTNSIPRGKKIIQFFFRYFQIIMLIGTAVFADKSHRSLIKNKTQTAVINIFNLHILIKT